MDEIRVGDHVFIGRGKVHWVVEHIAGRDDYDRRDRLVALRSGLTGRRGQEWLSDLTLYARSTTGPTGQT